MRVLFDSCRALILPASLALLLPTWASAQRPRGILVLVGGEPISDSIDVRFVRLARAAGPGPVVILPMASVNGAEVARPRERIFRSLGVATITRDLTRESAGSDSVARILEQASGIRFPGFALLPEAVTNAHFLRRQRHNACPARCSTVRA